MKKSKSNGEEVTFKDFVMATENILNDASGDAYEHVKIILEIYFKKKKAVTSKEMEGFFGEFSGYFQDDDIMNFLNELVYIKKEKDEIYLHEVASLIRDDVDMFFK